MLKEKYEKDMAAYRTKVKPGAVKTGVVKAEGGKKKKEERDEEEDEEENDKLIARPPLPVHNSLLSNKKIEI